MLVNVDAKHLDWTAAVFLSQDSVGIQEIKEGFDLHTDNQKAFDLGEGSTGRLLAKKLLFRIIFGGTAYSFYRDQEFASLKYSLDKWEYIIEKFYKKYKGVYYWHNELIKTASTKKEITIPTGRQWKFNLIRNYKGDLEWPITQIKNYPVQGLEADLMALTRVSIHSKIKHKPEILLINSVHDSILFDCPDDEVTWLSHTVASVFKHVPQNFKILWGVDFNLPFRGELSIGKDWKNMEEVSGLIWE